MKSVLVAAGIWPFEMDEDVTEHHAEWLDKNNHRNVYCTHRIPDWPTGTILFSCAKNTGGRFYAAHRVIGPARDTSQQNYKYEVPLRPMPLAMVDLAVAPMISSLGVSVCPRTWQNLTDEQGVKAMRLLGQALMQSF